MKLGKNSNKIPAPSSQTFHTSFIVSATCSLLPTPYSLKPKTLYLTKLELP
ncbi:MAG: hypothetical protein F6K55_20165 [Moorea sp. SIO4A3]|nr:hypothetical protein [Moorena sp. SIO4A3]